MGSCCSRKTDELHELNLEKRSLKYEEFLLLEEKFGQDEFNEV